MKLASIAAMACGLLGGQAAMAQTQYVTIASDDFSSSSYTTGSTVAGVNGGTGWTASWNSGSGNAYGVVSSTSLTYTDANGSTMTSSRSMAVSGATATANPQRSIATTSGSTLGALCSTYGSVYVSFLYQDLNASTGAGNSAGTVTSGLYRQQNVGLFQGTGEYLDVGLANIASGSTVTPTFSLWGSGKGKMGSTPNSTAPNQSSVSAVDGSVDLIVMQITADTSSTTTDTINIWINPTLDSNGYAITTGTPTLTYTGQDLTGINYLRFQAGNVSSAYGTLAGDMSIGDIQLYAVAVPEPGSLALALCGGLSLLFARNRKQ